MIMHVWEYHLNESWCDCKYWWEPIVLSSAIHFSCNCNAALKKFQRESKCTDCIVNYNIIQEFTRKDIKMQNCCSYETIDGNGIIMMS